MRGVDRGESDTGSLSCETCQKKGVRENDGIETQSGAG